MFEQPCKVNLGDNRSSLAYGKGTYNLVADLNSHNQNIVLREVLFIPDLGKNVLSVRVMVKLGASVGFKGDLCKVTRNSKLLAMGERCGKLYMLKVIPGRVYQCSKGRNRYASLALSVWAFGNR